MIKINSDWKFEEYFPKISAYTTTWNCIDGSYRFDKAIKSFAWADEVIVVDGGSTDGTREKLSELQKELGDHIKVYDMPIDLDDPGCDGQQKALARAMCMNPFLIQFDADEYCMGDSVLWKSLVKDMPDNVDIYSLPVYEPLGNSKSLRTSSSFNIWKWRISRNKPEITHGIPKQDRLEVDGKVYSKGNSDGCFPVHIASYDMISHCFPKNWFTSELYQLRDSDLDAYKNKLEDIFEFMPFVYHAGHVDLKSKIKLYLKTWHKFWCHLFNKDPEDPVNNKYFPGIAISDVTEDMIKEKVEEITNSEKTIEVDAALRKYVKSLAPE